MSPLEKVLSAVGACIIILVVLVAIGTFIFGIKPAPCPRHICIPQDEQMSPERYMREHPEYFQNDRSESIPGS